MSPSSSNPVPAVLPLGKVQMYSNSLKPLSTSEPAALTVAVCVVHPICCKTVAWAPGNSVAASTVTTVNPPQQVSKL